MSEEFDVQPAPVAGYPQSDVIPPNATGGNMTTVQNQHAAFSTALSMEDMARRIAELEAENEALQERPVKTKRTAPVAEVSASQGGEPVPHHLHLTDGRVITDHGGHGTHYSETLPDGSSRVTRIASFYPAALIDPVELFA